jgi:hypothetical protein
MDIVALSALIISILTVLGGILVKLHMSHCKSFCIESDCRNNNNKTIDDPVDEITVVTTTSEI